MYVMDIKSKQQLQTTLNNAVNAARHIQLGKLARYIPELAAVSPDLTAVSVNLIDGNYYTAGDINEGEMFTIQSVGKLVVFIGLLEEFGIDKVYTWTRTEPSGDDFASIARLDQFGPIPSNPMLNAGAISLCSRIPGNMEQKLAWLERWVALLFGRELKINTKVFHSEQQTGDRNRALAYLMRSSSVIQGDIDSILETYFYLCSFECSVKYAAYLPMLLANAGLAPNGNRIISKNTVGHVLAVMATCGLYNESGVHLVRTGLPAKSGVSGFILAAAPKRAGIAVFSPRVNVKGTSVRGEFMLEKIARELGWHFAW